MRQSVSSVLVLCLAACACFAQHTEHTPAETKQPRPGILLFAHGGRVTTWNEEVRHIADHVDLKIPTEVAFGMATRSSLQAGIDRLAARGVTEIIAVPLFISSHSSVIDSTSYLLGLRSEAPKDLKLFAAMDHGAGMDMSHMEHMKANPEAMTPVHSPVPVRMTSALDHHPIVADILVDRAATISQDPAKEVVVLVAHGPVEDHENQLWLKEMGMLADGMKKKASYADIIYLTVRDDADKNVRDQATQELRKKVEDITSSGKAALVVPLLLSYGGIENGIRDRLKGLVYKMPAQALLPDSRAVDWVFDMEHEALLQK